MKNRNIQQLRLIGLPVFHNLQDLAELIHIRKELLNRVIATTSKFYNAFSIKKRSGGEREIEEPADFLKGIQAWILRNILDRLEPSAFATAYRSNIGLTANVGPHRNNRYFLCLDFADFFPSINRSRVERTFTYAGYDTEAGRILAALCTLRNHLPQGAVTSPALSNLVAAKLDRRLAGLTSRRNIVYTRYADDLTFSSNSPKILRVTGPLIERIVCNEHFTVNPNKTRFMGPRIRTVVTGMTKESSVAGFRVGRTKKRKVRAAMWNLLVKKLPAHPYKSETAINGFLSHVKNVDRRSYEQLSIYWQNLRSKVGPK
ncbi:retron St85 family RNA-directed DNA polymerase [Elusimicrobiota bacterium]